MNQKKTGAFLKELRNEKGYTQEQFAEKLNISNRTVSRWENGVNLPDIDLLILISDYYGVDLREILDGERKSEKMDIETEKIVLKAVEYTNTETERYNNRVHWLLLVGAILWFISQLISHTELDDNAILSVVSDFASGAASVMIICGIIATSRFGMKLKSFKQRMLKRN